MHIAECKIEMSCIESENVNVVVKESYVLIADFIVKLIFFKRICLKEVPKKGSTVEKSSGTLQNIGYRDVVGK